MRRLAVVLALAALAVIAGPAPDAAAADPAAEEAAYGAGSVLGTLLYAPLKTSFCVVGGVTSALTLPFGGTETASEVAAAACGGTWLITPGVLKGQEPVRFVGGDARPLVSARRYAGSAR